MNGDFQAQVTGIGTLAEPTRRTLYLYVAAQPAAVSREQVADDLQLPLHSVKFHLDRLAEEGLLDIEFRRLSDRTGPGAGRPSKLYRRSAKELAVSLPERRYDLVGEVLAEAIERSVRDGVAVRLAVQDAASAEGRRIAAEAERDDGEATDLERAATALAGHGYEPRMSSMAGITLGNCPFHSLARAHTQLVCTLNVALVEGVLEGLRCTDLEAVLDPQPGLCCVVVRRRR
jgi:predicted ArsR family transcriptional regulator